MEFYQNICDFDVLLGIITKNPLTWKKFKDQIKSFCKNSADFLQFESKIIFLGENFSKILTVVKKTNFFDNNSETLLFKIL